MKFLFTADFHLTTRKTDEYRWDIFKFLGKRCKQLKIDGIFILGDLTDKKDNHPSVLVNRLVNELLELADEFPISIIKGNHDYVDKDSPFFNFLDNLPGVAVYSSPADESILIEDDGARILYLPHTKQRKKDWKEFDFDDYSIILLHQALIGSVASSGYTMDKGTPPSLFSTAKTQAVVIAGDIHVPQEVGNVTYCGSPHPIAFGDSFDPRVLVYDTNEGELKSYNHIGLKKHKVSVSAPNDIFKEAEILDICEGDHVRVDLHLSKAELVSWEELRSKTIKNCKELGVILFGVNLIVKMEDNPGHKGRKRLQKSALHTMTEVYKRYCGEKDFPKAVVEAGAEIMKELDSA